MRIVSWNVNGLRSALRKGFLDYLGRSGADVLGLQELRALPEDLPAQARSPEGYRAVFRPAERKGYSGVALYCRERPRRLWTDLGVPDFDREGRLLGVDLGPFVLFNIYFPNGSGDRDNSRVPFKLDFYRRVLDQVEEQRSEGREVVVMGDFNTAHRPIDLARPAANRKSSGFLPEECAELDRWLEAGLVDSFRHVHGDVPDRYTWWTYRGGARARNVGWRIDYVWLTPGLLPNLEAAEIEDGVQGSDHCPVSVDLRFS